MLCARRFNLESCWNMRGSKVKLLKRELGIPHPGRKFGGNKYYWMKVIEDGKKDADVSLLSDNGTAPTARTDS